MRIQEAVVVILAKEMTASFVIRGDVETLIGNLKFDVWYINQKFSISFNLRGLGEPFENNDKLVITPAFKSQIRLNEIFKQRNPNATEVGGTDNGYASSLLGSEIHL